MRAGESSGGEEVEGAGAVLGIHGFYRLAAYCSLPGVSWHTKNFRFGQWQ